MEFNSEKNDENDVFSTILGAMKDQKFSLTMSKAGKVTDVKNVDALWSKAINQFDQLPEMQKEQIKAQIIFIKKASIRWTVPEMSHNLSADPNGVRKA